MVQLDVVARPRFLNCASTAGPYHALMYWSGEQDSILESINYPCNDLISRRKATRLNIGLTFMGMCRRSHIRSLLCCQTLFDMRIVH